MAIKNISVVGIGKLGLCMAASFANKGYKVIGVDLNPATIQAVNEGRSPIYEPGLDDLIKKSHTNLSATDNYKYAIEHSQITFIVVTTPSEPSGKFSTRYVEIAIEQIANCLKNKSDFHVVVLTSTVLPGATDAVLKPLLERVSGKKCGVDFGLCYNPEFIALGSVIRDFTHPDVLLIGESDAKSGELLSQVLQNICENKPQITRTNFCNAELGKISINSYVTMKISFANFIAEMCERIPGGNSDVVSNLLGSDTRIGRKYLSGGLGFGGPCFPRDNRAIAYFANTLGCDALLPKATDNTNHVQNERIAELLKQHLGQVENKTISILGLTYKTSTNVIEESAAIGIAKILLSEGAKLKVYDPAGMENARMILGEVANYCSSINDCLKDSEFCIMATPWPEFKELKPKDFTGSMKQPVLLDCWRIYEQSEFSKKLKYLAIGLNLS